MEMFRKVGFAFIAITFIFSAVSCKQKDNHSHTYSTEWTSDAESHWHEPTCNDTEEVKDKAEHTFGEWSELDENGNRTRECTECGYEESNHEHVYSKEWSKNETNHWYDPICEDTEDPIGMGEHTFGDWSELDEDGNKTRECLECGYKESGHEHVYATAWSKDETKHWHEPTCADTKEVDGEAAHTFGEWSELDENGDKTKKCTVCGYEVSDHEHVFATEWKSDAENHWHVATCDDTEEVDGKAEHTFGEWSALDADGNKTKSCTVCGYEVSDHEHVFATEWKSDAENHWHVATCKDTEEDKDKAAHTFGEWSALDANGNKTKSCTVCGYEVSGHDHVYATEWKSDATNHWHEPTCKDTKEVKDKKEHTFGEWSALDANGNKTKSCTVCGYEVSGHDHVYATAWSKDATNHWHEPTCKDTTEVKDKKEHDWDAGTVTKPATTKAEGERTYKCKVCEQTKTGKIDKLPMPTISVTVEEPVQETDSLTLTNAIAAGKVTLTAASGFAKYIWYVDGTVVASSTANTYEINAAELSAGVHNAMVVALDADSKDYSATCALKITK